MLFTGLILLAVHITLSSAHEGACDEKGPICGNDGKTYPTMCQMIWARLEDPDLAVLHEGACDEASEKILEQDHDAVRIESRNVVKSVKDNARMTDYEKIKEVMPVGWPPLGPILITNITRS